MYVAGLGDIAHFGGLRGQDLQHNVGGWWCVGASD